PAPRASESEPTTEEPAPTAEEPPAVDETTPDGTQSRLAAPEDGLVAPFALGPDGATPPYIYWTAVDGDGDLLGGTTFNAQARGGGPGGWSGGSLTVIADCAAAPCTGF